MVVPDTPADGDAPHSILLAEDELLVRLCIAQELRDAGYVVHEAAEAREALSVLEEKTVDILLTDIRMPGAVDGLELAKRVREEHPQICVMLLSANLTRDTEKFDGAFSKPVRIADLIAGVRKVLPKSTGADG